MTRKIPISPMCVCVCVCVCGGGGGGGGGGTPIVTAGTVVG